MFARLLSLSLLVGCGLLVASLLGLFAHDAEAPHVAPVRPEAASDRPHREVRPPASPVRRPEAGPRFRPDGREGPDDRAGADAARADLGDPELQSQFRPVERRRKTFEEREAARAFTPPPYLPGPYPAPPPAPVPMPGYGPYWGY